MAVYGWPSSLPHQATTICEPPQDVSFLGQESCWAVGSCDKNVYVVSHIMASVHPQQEEMFFKQNILPCFVWLGYKAVKCFAL